MAEEARRVVPRKSHSCIASRQIVTTKHFSLTRYFYSVFLMLVSYITDTLLKVFWWKMAFSLQQQQHQAYIYILVFFESPDFNHSGSVPPRIAEPSFKDDDAAQDLFSQCIRSRAWRRSFLKSIIKFGKWSWVLLLRCFVKQTKIL